MNPPFDPSSSIGPQSQQGTPQLPGIQEQIAPTGFVPPEIRKEMEILTGGLDFNADGEIVPANDRLLESKSMNAQDKWKAGMLKKHEIKNAKTRYSKSQVYAFDLSNEQDRTEYAKILDQAGQPGTSMLLNEEPIHIDIDPSAPRGFRAVVIVRTFHVDKVLPEGMEKPEYAVPPVIAGEQKEQQPFGGGPPDKEKKAIEGAK